MKAVVFYESADDAAAKAPVHFPAHRAWWQGFVDRGELPTELVPHFFRSMSEALKATLHVSVAGGNTHHMVEACFKSVGRALRQAFRCEGHELPSTKGIL